MNNEFKKITQDNVTRYVLESDGGTTSSGSIASDSSAGFKKGLLLTPEGNKKTNPPKTRNPVAKNASAAIGGGAAGAHKDKKKAAKQGQEKHKKPYMEALQARLDQLKSNVEENTQLGELSIDTLRSYVPKRLNKAKDQISADPSKRNIEKAKKATTQDVPRAMTRLKDPAYGKQGVAEGLNEFAQGDFNGGDDSNDLQLYLNVAKKLNMKKYKPSIAHDLIAKKMAELVDVVDDARVDWARHMARKAQGLPSMLDQQGVAEALDSNFVGFMNKTLGQKADAPTDKSPMPDFMKGAPVAGLDSMGYKAALDFGMKTLRKLTPTQKTKLSIKGEDGVVNWLANQAKKQGLLITDESDEDTQGKFMQEDLDEVQDFLPEVFHDPAIKSWAFVLTDGEPLPKAPVAGPFKVGINPGITGQNGYANADWKTVDTLENLPDARDLAQGLSQKNPKQFVAIWAANGKSAGFYWPGEGWRGIDEGVAEGFFDQFRKKQQNYEGIDVSVEKEDNNILVKATANGRELGRVLFTPSEQDDNLLVPLDLEVDERYRGQGIGATMYDYVKSLGYTIRRSQYQTDAGAGFWDKHKSGKNVWEQGVAEGFNGEYDDEAGMAQSNLLTTARAVMGLLKTIKDRDNLPEWGQEKIAKAEMMLVSVWDYLQSQKAMGNDPQQGVAEGLGDSGFNAMMGKITDPAARESLLPVEIQKVVQFLKGSIESLIEVLKSDPDFQPNDVRNSTDLRDMRKNLKSVMVDSDPKNVANAIFNYETEWRETMNEWAEEALGIELFTKLQNLYYGEYGEGVAEGKADYNFDIEDLKRLERIRDLATMKAQAMALISKPSAKPMKPEKVEWFKNALERMNSPLKVIKMMYDLMLSGEGHSVIGTKSSMNPNNYRQRFGEQGVDESWKSKLGGAALAGAMALGASGAHADMKDVPAGGHNQLPDIVAHVKFKVGDKEVTKDINLGSYYRSPSEAGKELENFLKSKGIKFYEYSLERVKPTNNNLDNSPAVGTGNEKPSIDTNEPSSNGKNTGDYMAKEGAKVDRQAKHITASMMKKGKSKEDAESIAWAHIKHPKSESADSYFESLTNKLAEKLDPNAPVDDWVQDFAQANPEKYHQFRQNNRPGTRKSEKKIERMAQAASYAAKTGK